MAFLVVFLVATALDFVWAEYIKATAGHRAYKASALSAIIAVCGGLIAIEYIADHWLLLAFAAGSALGTYISVRRGK